MIILCLKVKTESVTKPQLGSRDFIVNDLKKLTEQVEDEFPDGDEDDDDLPPLIQVSFRLSFITLGAAVV